MSELELIAVAATCYAAGLITGCLLGSTLRRKQSEKDRQRAARVALALTRERTE